MSKFFFDTNILIYSLDSRDRKKQKQARHALKTAGQDGQGVISTQILQEFFVAATKKLGVDPLEAKSILRSFLNFEVVLVDADLIANAVDISILNKLSFWDALIVASAESARCEQLWTEDLNHGQIIQGVKVINPLL